jgi:hypothetical protein
MQTSEDLVCLIYYDKVKRWSGTESSGTAFATRKFAAD